jgi:hypothetical protein
MSPAMQAYRAADAARTAYCDSIDIDPPEGTVADYDKFEWGWDRPDHTDAEIAEWERHEDICAELYNLLTEKEQNSL